MNPIREEWTSTDGQQLVEIEVEATTVSDAMIQMAPGSRDGDDDRYETWLDAGDDYDCGEPTGSCEHCGTNLYDDEGPLCGQCEWSINMGASRSNEEVL